MSKIKLVVFDCDGVMFDSRDANKYYYNHLLAQFGHPEMDEDELAFVHAHSVLDSIDYIFRRHPGEVPAVHRYREVHDYTPYLRYMNKEPDLEEFLDYLRPAHHTAISTNRTTTMPAVLKMFGLEASFEMVVTAFDVARPKPHPEALFKILDHFKLAPAQAVFIGDSMVDKEHAEAAGVPLIAFKSPELPAAFHVSRFMEIPALPLFQAQEE